MAQVEKHLPAMREIWVQSLGWEASPKEENGNPLQYSCLENPYGQRSLVGYSPWGRKESDPTERLHFLTQPYRLVYRLHRLANGELQGCLRQRGPSQTAAASPPIPAMSPC